MVVPAGRKAVFLDRDGVIVIPEFRDGRSFAPRRLEDFRFYPDAAESLARLKSKGFLLVVVSNQPDVGAGLIPEEVMVEMNRRLLASFPLDAIKICHHTRTMMCSCRKPKPGLLLEAAEELGIALSDSFMVGDRASDVEAGEAAGCRTVFIDLNYVEPKPSSSEFTVRSISEAVEVIVATS
jgi:D-glycero-D-manno-heptose 1,7-bisphosphate phosphatase